MCQNLDESARSYTGLKWPVSKDYVLYYSIYVRFSKHQDSRKGGRMSGCQRLGTPWAKGEEGEEPRCGHERAQEGSPRRRHHSVLRLWWHRQVSTRTIHFYIILTGTRMHTHTHTNESKRNWENLNKISGLYRCQYLGFDIIL